MQDSLAQAERHGSPAETVKMLQPSVLLSVLDQVMQNIQYMIIKR